ncbi:MAG: hypothetical protein Q8R28_21720, partial [Dehalococcoidia bacterium]|nr:hypothetical protein [Dehalococcoidia bacterium]
TVEVDNDVYTMLLKLATLSDVTVETFAESMLIVHTQGLALLMANPGLALRMDSMRERLPEMAAVFEVGASYLAAGKSE